MLGLHHLRSRELASRGLEPFPARSFLKRLLDYVMYAVGIAAPLALLPQVFQIYASKSAAGISLPTWCALATFNVLWVLYGIVHRDKPIIITNILFALFNGLIFVGALLY